MKKIIAVVALDPRASEFYAKQVQELFGSYVMVYSYSVLAGTIMNMKRADLYLMSTDAFDNRADVPQYIPIDAQISEIHVTYRWDTIQLLQSIPPGTRALFVNMTEKMVREATTTLNQLGVNHIEFIPFYPGASPVDHVELAVTPEEERYVPSTIKRIINIGHRSCTSGTMIEVALKLGLEFLLENSDFKRYFEETATSNYNFDLMFAKSRTLESQFDILMEILDEGIVGVNEKAEIFAVNEKAQEIVSINKELVLHKNAAETLACIPFLECLKTKMKLDPKVVKINGVPVSVAVSPVLRNGECTGAFAVLQRFHDAENRQNELRSQLMHKGYRAKYTFDDVVGESEGIQKTITILKRMAYTESPILLIGETGTGKELFAHAVHQASRRLNGPFVAINCGAMPENLLESELFGYEEGAFTGAKRGGRPGLFEFAHHGTLFLDEVEGMSPALQVKLLRVLQEYEIMRVGGNKIIPIDVRIVAATNESLEQKVEDGSFRRDLYYRINTLPVLIPPLRMRDLDVFLLLERFGKETNRIFVLSKEVEEIFRTYSWPGNIRELHNVAEYFSYTGSPVITCDDLPPTFIHSCTSNKQLPLRQLYGSPENKNENSSTSTEEIFKILWKERGIPVSDACFVMELLYKNSCNCQPIGRETILNQAKEHHIPMSQLEVRMILKILAEQEWAKVSRGRGGSQMTSKGRDVWEALNL